MCQAVLNSFKSKADKIDVDKLKPAPVDLKNLSDVVGNDVVKKTPYDELVKKIFRLLAVAIYLKKNWLQHKN